MKEFKHGRGGIIEGGRQRGGAGHGYGNAGSSARLQLTANCD